MAVARRRNAFCKPLVQRLLMARNSLRARMTKRATNQYELSLGQQSFAKLSANEMIRDSVRDLSDNCRQRLGAPAQGSVKPAFALQLLNALDAQIFGSHEFKRSQSETPVGCVQLLDAAPHRPLRLEFGQRPRDLAAIDAITTEIGSAAFGVFDHAVWHYLANDFGNVANPVILLALAHVERLIMNRLARRMQDRKKRPADVLDMHQRTPRSAVALNHDLFRGVGVTNETVHHEVHAQARGDAVGGCIA